MRVPFLRTVQNGFYPSISYQAHNLAEKYSVPLWTRQPTSLQVDTTIRKCPLNCVYCNVQDNFIPENPERFDLPLPTIEHVCKEISGLRWRLEYAYPYMNSDPLCDLRLHEIAKVLKKELKCLTLLSTNGVLWKRRDLLRDRNLNDVYFTFSADNGLLYEKVHGKPFFQEALKTIVWLEHNRFWNQRVGVRYILFRENKQGLAGWQELFEGLLQEVRPLHFSFETRLKSYGLKDTVDPLLQHYYKRQQEFFASKKLPCNCFHNLAVSYTGEIMQCCDLPYKYSWGHVEEVDIEEVWQKRLEIGLNHPGCRGCNQKNRDWRSLFEKYVWN